MLALPVSAPSVGDVCALWSEGGDIAPCGAPEVNTSQQ